MLLFERRLLARPAVCHTIWLTVLAVLLLPPTVLPSSLAIRGHVRDRLSGLEDAAWARLERLDPTLVWGGEPETSEPAQTVVTPGWQERGQAYFAPDAEAGVAGTPLNLQRVLPPLRDRATDSDSTGETSGVQPGLGVIAVRVWVRTIWFGGALAFLGLFLWRVRRIDRLVRRSTGASDALDRRVREVARQLGVEPPNVRCVAGLATPMLWGCGRPVMLWPLELDPDDGGSAGLVAHELAHLRRRDHWTACVQVFASALLWWHPLVWLAQRRLARFAELACDAWAVRAVGCARRDYAEALIAVIERLGRQRALALAASGSGRRAVVERLRVVMASHASARGSRALALASVTLVALLLPTISTGGGIAEQDDRLAPIDSRLEPLVACAAARTAGDDWYEAGVWMRAETYYSRAIQLDATDPHVAARLGITLFRIDELDDSRHWLEEAINLGARQAELRFYLAAVHARRGELDAALAQLERSLKSGFDVARRLESEQVFEELNQHEGWRGFAERARRVSTLRESARTAMKQRDAASARTALSELATLCPDDGAIWHYLSYCCIALKQFDQAERALQMQRKLGFRPSIEAYNEACLHALLGRTDKALEAFERAVEHGFSDYALARTDPDLESLRSLARFEQSLERVKTADRLKKEIELAGEFFEWDRVLTLCEQACQTGRQDLQAWCVSRRAEALAELGRLDEARELLIQSIQKGYSVKKGLFELSRVHAIAGQEDDAAAYLVSAARCGLRDPDRIAADTHLASLMQRSEVRAAMMDAVEREELAHFGVESWQDLAARARSTLDVDPQALEALHELGWAHLRMGEYADAEKCFVRLFERRWRPHVSAYNLACCHALTGNSEEALDWLEQAVSQGPVSFKMIEADRDLASLRELPRFRQIVERVRIAAED
ncbi:MAG: hypothetical protein D6695_07125 [Planctomycetota bacterium]|nr:MAG: hypothetical protein D6695_07125 [Planctomycetota bacterium]